MSFLSSRAIWTVLLAAFASAALAACGAGQRKPRTATRFETETTPSGGDGGYESSEKPAAPGRGAQRATVLTTRTATAPAFLSTPSEAAALAAAVRTVEAHGYRVASTSTYRSEDALRVLIGQRYRRGNREEQAFFFLDSQFLGTDASNPSSSLAVVSQGESEATLAYGLYHPSNPPCCASGQASVRFFLNDGALQREGAIPPLSLRR